ncbi:hypothetical protein [Phyllobacterium bourgognense]|nr:hypothetical protein [Phyllobacterium bourgognense]
MKSSQGFPTRSTANGGGTGHLLVSQIASSNLVWPILVIWKI